MVEQQNTSGVQDQQVSDNVESSETRQETNENQDHFEPKKDTVAYDTYRKVLGEKKKIQARLEEFERQQKENQQKSLLEQQKYKEAYEHTKQEAETLKQQLEGLRRQEMDGRKLQTFLESIDGRIEQKYWNHIDLDKILIDEETGEVDKMSVTRQVEYFKNTYPEIIQRPNKSPLPPNSPQVNSQGMVSQSDWEKMKLEEKRKFKPQQIVWGQ